jgi:hypothetical protein
MLNFLKNSKGDSKGTDQEKVESDKKVPRGPKCFECSGYGHIRVDCGNLKQSIGKAYNATLSDDLDNDETPGKDFNYLTFAASYDSLYNFNDYYYENCATEDEKNEFQRVYNKLYVKSTELREVNKQHVKRLNDLEIERSKLIEKIKCLEDELIESQMQLEKFSSDKLVQMLKGQKCAYDQTGLGFDKFAASSSQLASTSKIVFFKSEMSEPHVACLDKRRISLFMSMLNLIYLLKSILNLESYLPVKKHDPKKGKSGTRPPLTHYAPPAKETIISKVCPYFPPLWQNWS